MDFVAKQTASIQPIAVSGTVTAMLPSVSIFTPRMQDGKPVKTTSIAPAGAGHSAPAELSDMIESAVYSYIQAYRALGNTRINTVRIARGLNISRRLVEGAVLNLRDKGVIPSNG